MKNLSIAALLAWLAFGAGGTVGAGGVDEAAWREIERGGVAILLRHAATQPGIGDPESFRLDDCATQRNLSAAGREQARRFGAAILARKVRIDEVRTSHWCRCIDTATLAFPGREVRRVEALDSFFADRQPAPRRTAQLTSDLEQLAPPRNVVLVTHQVNITALTGQSVAAGEALVVRATAAGVQVVGRIDVR